MKLNLIKCLGRGLFVFWYWQLIKTIRHIHIIVKGERTSLHSELVLGRLTGLTGLTDQNCTNRFTNVLTG